MFEAILQLAGAAATSIPFTAATWFVIGILLCFVWVFSRASRNPNSPIKWEHMIIDSSTDRASPYKVGYLIGMIVGTWVIVTMTDRDKLTFDILGLYLTYLLGGASWSSFIKNKSTQQPSQPQQ